MKRFSSSIGILTALAIALGVTLVASDRVREQKLQQAIDLVESKGDLTKATPLFEEVAKSDDRTLAGRALLYLAQAQERHGHKDAVVTYRRLEKDFAADPAVASVARRRIAALTPRPAQAGPRQLLEDGLQVVDVSADGRLAVGYQPAGLGLYDVGTGQIRHLQTGAEGGGNPVLSADGRFVAYSSADRQAPTEDRSTLRVTGVEPNATPRTIRPVIPGVQSMVPRAWSPDGKSILASFNRRPNIDGPRTQPLAHDLVWITVATGEVRTIKSFEPWQIVHPPKLSPDGAFIVFSAVPRRDEPATVLSAVALGEWHLFVMDANGAQVTDVVGIAGRNVQPAWSPTGSHIFFINDRIVGAGRSLWSVAVQGGRAVGEPAVVQRNFAGELLSATTSGALYYREVDGNSEMTFIAERGSGAARIVQAFEGGRASWSPTGESIALVKPQAPGVVVRSVDGGEERLYPGTDGAPIPPRWVKNASAFVVVSGGLGTPFAFQLVDLKTRTFKLLPGMTAVTGDRRWGVLSPDGSTLYAAVRDANRTPWTGIIAVDLVTGADRAVVTLPQPIPSEVQQFLALALSPDGSTIAMLAKHDWKQPDARLYSVRTDGTGFREIGPFPTVALSRRMMVWTPDGASILVVRTDADGAWRVMRVRAADGYVEPDGLDSTTMTGSVKIPKLQPGTPASFDISPDGSRLLFSAATVARHSLWSLDGAVRLLKTP